MYEGLCPTKPFFSTEHAGRSACNDTASPWKYRLLSALQKPDFTDLYLCSEVTLNAKMCAQRRIDAQGLIMLLAGTPTANSSRNMLVPGNIPVKANNEETNMCINEPMTE